jgi:hypothetical protein
LKLLRNHTDRWEVLVQSLVTLFAAVAVVSPALASGPDTAPPARAPGSPAVAEPANPAEAPKPGEPFAFADWNWLNGGTRQTEYPLDGKAISGQFSADVAYVKDFANPKDHTIVGSTASGRSSEVQVTHLGIGADLHWKNLRGRIMTQLGMYATMTPRNDASPGRGQWDLANAYRYVTEAYGGYHTSVQYALGGCQGRSQPRARTSTAKVRPRRPSRRVCPATRPARTPASNANVSDLRQIMPASPVSTNGPATWPAENSSKTGLTTHAGGPSTMTLPTRPKSCEREKATPPFR